MSVLASCRPLLILNLREQRLPISRRPKARIWKNSYSTRPRAQSSRMRSTRCIGRIMNSSKSHSDRMSLCLTRLSPASRYSKGLTMAQRFRNRNHMTTIRSWPPMTCLVNSRASPRCLGSVHSWEGTFQMRASITPTSCWVIYTLTQSTSRTISRILSRIHRSRGSIVRVTRHRSITRPWRSVWEPSTNLRTQRVSWEIVQPSTLKEASQMCLSSLPSLGI